MRAAGRALALDPGSVAAATLISELVLEAPAEMPEELRVEVARREGLDARAHTRVSVLGVAAYAGFLPVLLLVGVRDWAYLAVAFGLVAAIVSFYILSNRSDQPPRWRAWIGAVGAAIMVVVFGRLFGPFVLPQGLATAGLAVSATNPVLMKRGWLLVLMYMAAALGPWGLEALGVLAPTYSVLPGRGFLITSNVLEINPVWGPISIAFYIASVIAISGVLMLRIARIDRALRQKLEVQAWHLRHLVPVTR